MTPEEFTELVIRSPNFNGVADEDSPDWCPMHCDWFSVCDEYFTHEGEPS